MAPIQKRYYLICGRIIIPCSSEGMERLSFSSLNGTTDNTAMGTGRKQLLQILEEREKELEKWIQKVCIYPWGSVRMSMRLEKRSGGHWKSVLNRLIRCQNITS